MPEQFIQFVTDELVLIILIIITFIGMHFKVRWTCGLCGKTNETDIISYALQMCDHGGGLN